MHKDGNHTSARRQTGEDSGSPTDDASARLQDDAVSDVPKADGASRSPTEGAATEWFAIRSRQDFRVAETLAAECDEVFFPTECVRTPGGRTRRKAVIPHVLFIRTTRDRALELERRGRLTDEGGIPFWIYRFPKSHEIQTVAPASIHLLRILTADETARCEVYTAKELPVGSRVRVTGGVFAGYEGYVRRVRKDRRVVVEISGVCLVLLPFIHPDLLEPLP